MCLVESQLRTDPLQTLLTNHKTMNEKTVLSVNNQNLFWLCFPLLKMLHYIFQEKRTQNRMLSSGEAQGSGKPECSFQDSCWVWKNCPNHPIATITPYTLTHWTIEQYSKLRKRSLFSKMLFASELSKHAKPMITGIVKGPLAHQKCLYDAGISCHCATNAIST